MKASLVRLEFTAGNRHAMVSRVPVGLRTWTAGVEYEQKWSVTCRETGGAGLGAKMDAFSPTVAGACRLARGWIEDEHRESTTTMEGEAATAHVAAGGAGARREHEAG